MQPKLRLLDTMRTSDSLRMPPCAFSCSAASSPLCAILDGYSGKEGKR